MSDTLSSAIVFVGLCTLGLFLSVSYVADRERGLRWLVLGALALVDLAAIPFGVAYLVMPLVPGVSEALSASEVMPGIDGEWLVSRLPWLGVLAIATGVAGLLVLLPPVRRLTARVLPIDPQRTVHTTALHYAVFLTGTALLVPVFMPPLDDLGALQEITDSVAAGGLLLLWAQGIGFAAMAVLGVGLVVQRDARAVLERLGLTPRLALRWWVMGTLVALASSALVDLVWSAYGSENLEQVQRISEALFEPYLRAGLLGALTIGLSAGIGEEILFRGAAQPRLGLWFTSLLFAVVHTQYTISLALVQVLVVGLVLGLARKNANTTTAIAIHATYNFVIAILAIYAPELAP